jgi:TetR/AcrR family transcriptional regulator, regulator of cefoperazone and chloramphenicol sensitivity
MRSGPVDPDLTARARIRDAALARFGASGVAATTLRSSAADAGVSPALVVHHFGSKVGLRQACDAYVVETLRRGGGWARKQADPTGPQGLAAVGAMLSSSEPIRRYLARALLDDAPAPSALFDEMVDLIEDYLDGAQRDGTVRPTSDQRARASVLIVWQLSALAFGRHLARALGAPDVVTAAGAVRYSRAALEVYTHGLFADERWRTAYGALDRQSAGQVAAATAAPDPPAPAAADPTATPRRRPDDRPGPTAGDPRRATGQVLRPPPRPRRPRPGGTGR